MSARERDETEEEMVVAEAQCGLAHPRPARALNLKRFVGYWRERGGVGARGAAGARL
jgi:uncharacterized NAD-dependent epimerase/dehydratase family protein